MEAEGEEGMVVTAAGGAGGEKILTAPPSTPSAITVGQPPERQGSLAMAAEGQEGMVVAAANGAGGEKTAPPSTPSAITAVQPPERQGSLAMAAEGQEGMVVTAANGAGGDKTAPPSTSSAITVGQPPERQGSLAMAAPEGEEGMVATAAGSGGVDDEGTSKFSNGFRFEPTDKELVEFYLLPKLQGRPTVPNDAIIEANIYEFHPETLVHEKYKGRGEDTWFFLSPRARYNNGLRASRKTEDGRGRWMASSAPEVLVIDGIKFSKTRLYYYVGTLKNKQKTKWSMWEFIIPEYTINPGSNSATLDEYVMCKIYLGGPRRAGRRHSPMHKAIDEGAKATSECEDAQDTQATPESELSERKAGKRPSKVQSRARKRACKGSPAIEPTQPSGASYDPVLAHAQPAGCDGQAPLQRPPTPTQFPPKAATPYLNFNSDQMTTMVQPANLGFPASGTGFREQVPLNCYYDHNYRAVQPPGNVDYGMPPQQRPMAFAATQPDPFFNDNADDHAGALASPWPPYNSKPYEGCSMAQAAGDQGEATSSYAGSDMRGGNINAESNFVELAQPTRYGGHATVQRPPIPMQFPDTATTYPNSYGQMTTSDFRAPGTGFSPQVALNCYYDHSYWALQPPSNVAYRMPQREPMAFAPNQDHMYFNDHAGAVAFPCPSDNCNPGESSSVAQAASDQGEATTPNAVNAEDHVLAELPYINTSLAARDHSEATAPYGFVWEDEDW